MFVNIDNVLIRKDAIVSLEIPTWGNRPSVVIKLLISEGDGDLFSYRWIQEAEGDLPNDGFYDALELYAKWQPAPELEHSPSLLNQVRQAQQNAFNSMQVIR